MAFRFDLPASLQPPASTTRAGVMDPFVKGAPFRSPFVTELGANPLLDPGRETRTQQIFRNIQRLIPTNNIAGLGGFLRENRFGPGQGREVLRLINLIGVGNDRRRQLAQSLLSDNPNFRAIIRTPMADEDGPRPGTNPVPVER